MSGGTVQRSALGVVDRLRGAIGVNGAAAVRGSVVELHVGVYLEDHVGHGGAVAAAGVVPGYPGRERRGGKEGLAHDLGDGAPPLEASEVDAVFHDCDLVGTGVFLTLNSCPRGGAVRLTHVP